MTVLYEDARTTADQEFKLHDVLLRCILDRRTDDTEWELRKRVRARPRNGVDNLLKELVPSRLGKLRAGGAAVAVLFDSDKLHERKQLKLAPGASREAVKAAIVLTTRAIEADFELVLLEKNLETLLEVIARALSRVVPEKKDHASRDLLLQAAASASADVRVAILRGSPSFAQLVEVVDRLDAGRRPKELERP